jgi:hypothetical protein
MYILLNITMNIIYMGGFYTHVNGVEPYTDANQLTLLGEITGNAGDSFASMGDMMYMSNTYIAGFTGHGAPVVSAPIKRKCIGANKLNACLCIIVRCADGIFVWHLRYTDAVECNTFDELLLKIPAFLQIFHDQQKGHSPKNRLMDMNAVFYVSTRMICDTVSTKIFNIIAATGRSVIMLPLPDDLVIVSSGLESSIRSYSIGVCRDGPKEFLIISGESRNTGKNELWRNDNYKTWSSEML